VASAAIGGRCHVQVLEERRETVRTLRRDGLDASAQRLADGALQVCFNDVSFEIREG